MCSSQCETKILVPPKKYTLEELSDGFKTWCKDIWGEILHTKIDAKDLSLSKRTRLMQIEKVKKKR